MEQKTKERNTNIELFRIILMFFIIVHHLIYHNYLMFVQGDNNIIATILGAEAKIAVNCFILIMGYFAFESKWNIKKVIALTLETLFYIVIFMCIFERNITFQTIINNLKQYWFVTGYLIIYILSPIIKILVKKIPMYIQIAVLIPIFLLVLKNNRMPNIYIIWFILVFIVGIYTKKYLKNIFKINIFNILIAIILFIYVTVRYNGLELISISSLACAIFELLVFDNLKIKRSTKINNIAKYTIGVYLIHDNSYVRKNIVQNSLFIKEMYATDVFAIYTIGITVLIYGICIGIDILRKYIFDKILFKSKKLNAFYDSINKRMEKIGETMDKK